MHILIESLKLSKVVKGVCLFIPTLCTPITDPDSLVHRFPLIQNYLNVKTF